MIEENSVTYKLLHSKSFGYIFLRLIVFAPVGFGIGYFFWYFSLEDSDVIDGLTKESLKWSVIGAFSLGCVFIPIIRCMAFITLVNLTFGEGQSVVKISIMMSINEVLIFNLMKNHHSASESMKCNMILAQNYSKTRYMLLNEPTQAMLFNMAAGSQESQRVVGVVEDIFVPLEDEFVDERTINMLQQQKDQDLAKSIVMDKGDEVMEAANKNVDPKDIAREDAKHEKQLKKFRSEIAQMYSKKMFLRCENIFGKAYLKCHESMADIHKRCMYYWTGFPFYSYICGSLSSQRLCYLFSLLRKRDDACSEGDTGIPEQMKNIEQELADAAQSSQQVMDQFEVNVQFEAQIPLRRLKIFSVEQAFSRIDANFDELKSFLAIVQTVFLVVRLAFVGYSLYVTFKWLRSYLGNVTHENILITTEFLQIDKRRQLERRQNFQKFRKFELRRINTQWWQPRLSKAERNRMFKGVFELGYLAVFILVFTYAATIFYDLLMAVYKYSRFNSQQVGYHQLSMTVKGSGFLAKMVGSILDDFNKTIEVNQTLDNEECRVQPQELNWSSYDGITWIWILYSLLFLQKIFFAYIIRLRVVFASISFPDRAHTRVLWLYNDMLAVRYKKFFFAKDAMESWVDEPEKIPQEDSSNFLLRSLPQLCFVLKFFIRQNCFFCDDKTNVKNKKRYCVFHNVYFCDDCLGSYPCFKECYACRVYKWRQHFYAPSVVKIPLRRAAFQCSGLLVCRETLTHSWQFLLLQSRKNPTNWSPPKGIVKQNENLLEAAIRFTFEETGLHNCLINPIQGDPYHQCDYEFVKESEDCVVYPKANVGYKKVTYWVAVLAYPDVNIRLSEKHLQFGWYDVERACKLALYQNCPSAFLKADYFVRKVLRSS